jgi:hypothetical protein
MWPGEAADRRWLGGSNVSGRLFSGLKFGGRRPQGGGQPALGHQAFNHPVAEVIPRPFGQDPPKREPGPWAQTTGQKPESEADSGPIEVVVGGPTKEGLHFAKALELPFGEPEVVGEIVARRHLSGRVNG